MKRRADDSDRYRDRHTDNRHNDRNNDNRGSDAKRQRHASDDRQRNTSDHYARRDARCAPIQRTDADTLPPATNERVNSGGDRSGSETTRSNAADPSVRLLSNERETDPHRLAQRQKQIDYGKNTVGYDRYCANVPRHERRRGAHPMTPDKTLSVGKKVFDGMVRKWRQALHTYDPPELQAAVVSTTGGTQQPADAAAPSAAAVVAPSSATDASTASDDAADLDLDPAQHPLTAAPHDDASPRSIYENFVEDDDFGDDDDDDLL